MPAKGGVGNITSRRKITAMAAAITWAAALCGSVGLPAAASAAPRDAGPAAETAAVQLCLGNALAGVDARLTGLAKTHAETQALGRATTCAIAAGGASTLLLLAADAVSAGVSVPDLVVGILPAAISNGTPVATAVDDVEVGAVSRGASPAIVAEAIIAIGIQDQLANDEIASGLGTAAATLSNGNPGAAAQVAQVIVNEGTVGMGQAFASAVLAAGGPEELASLASQSPIVTGMTGQTTSFANLQEATGIHGTNDTALPPCQGSPSCS